MEPDTVTMIAALATLGIALAALGITIYATRLAKQTGEILEEMKVISTEMKEVLLGQQIISIAQARAIDGLRAGVQHPTIGGGLIGGSFEENLAQVLRKHNIQPRMVTEASTLASSSAPAQGEEKEPALEGGSGT